MCFRRVRELEASYEVCIFHMAKRKLDHKGIIAHSIFETALRVTRFQHQSTEQSQYRKEKLSRFFEYVPINQKLVK